MWMPEEFSGDASSLVVKVDESSLTSLFVAATPGRLCRKRGATPPLFSRFDDAGLFEDFEVPSEPMQKTGSFIDRASSAIEVSWWGMFATPTKRKDSPPLAVEFPCSSRYDRMASTNFVNEPPASEGEWGDPSGWKADRSKTNGIIDDEATAFPLLSELSISFKAPLTRSNKVSGVSVLVGRNENIW
jgi:hypothetical protein